MVPDPTIWYRIIPKRSLSNLVVSSSGIYTCLFFTTTYISLRKRMLHTIPAKVFFVATIVMYANCTTHVAINLYRLLQGYVYQRTTVGPENYFADLGRWDNIVHDALNALMTWMGDSLIIYRCYLVWDNNIYIVILPALLLIVSIVSNSVALHLFTQVPLGTIFGPSLVAWMRTIYATAFAQNALTTGLIAYRIWRQEMNSRRAGLRSKESSSDSLLPAIRIIVDSAALYMALLLCLIVLYAINHNGQFVMQEASVPAIGKSIVLLSLSEPADTRLNKALCSAQSPFDFLCDPMPYGRRLAVKLV
ncbi:hypothetical protein E1B28_001517 [Marasmius oreades]|uniref:Uncharacterized protein n=1 Tax=Marasmius oreades TaxID=181124 RepID=A0A9P7V3X2_9AGAR|nr:uncharacterized protein E1B28_001517 [Marasmius oreades]KAG7099697.1 hypothetical protein E1B28_001517 [Marasmius oreades]